MEGLIIESVEVSQEEIRKNKEKKKNRRNATIGGFILFFALIGIIASIVFIVGLISNALENQDEKDMYAEYLYPLVMQDPPEFGKIEQLPQSTILSAAVWNLLNNGDLSKYEKDEYGFMSVSQSDIEVYATKLFGEGLSFEHQSIGDAHFSFSYNSDEGTYLISDTPMFTYVPRVSKVDHDSETDEIVLTVDYLNPTVAFTGKTQNAQEVKVMEYRLDRLENGFKVNSIKIISSSNT